MSARMVFGSVIALVLLGLYVYLIWSATSVVGCTPKPICLGDFTDKMASALSLIAGLIGALVIAELAITEPGQTPVARALAPTASAGAVNVLKVVTFVYLGVWILCGLGALLVGWRHPNDVEALTNLGESWFGLAIAAAYSYFGIKK